MYAYCARARHFSTPSSPARIAALRSRKIVRVSGADTLKVNRRDIPQYKSKGKGLSEIGGEGCSTH